MGYHRKKQPKRVIKPKKFVKVDAKTTIEVDFDIPDNIAVKNWEEKLESSKPKQSGWSTNTKKT